MPIITESEQIQGVYLVKLDAYQDDRGRFTEIFRKEWFPQCKWSVVQSNRSESAANVLRGLHYHHNQVDYWHLVQGGIRSGLVDLRHSSPTSGAVQTIDIFQDDGVGLFIPAGVAHGFLSLLQSTLIYIVDRYYDGSDEHGVAWNDPDINLNWGHENPTISERDINNPLLAAIPTAKLPR
jgi:dTDP-4-dehydrorhamnose 3,5-epimerase